MVILSLRFSKMKWEDISKQLNINCNTLRVTYKRIKEKLKNHEKDNLFTELSNIE